MLRLVTTLIASEVERVRAPERASEEAATSFQRAVLARRIEDRDDLIARGKELGTDLGGRRQRGRRPRPPPQPDRGRLAPAAAGRRRPRRALDRARRDRRPDRRATPARSWCSSPTPTATPGAAVSAAILRELESGLPGFAFAIGRSRRVEDPLELHRAGNEALLAANVVEGDAERVELAYEETGTYQLLLPYMSDPAELKRFYDETVRPLVAYDEQYETDLLGTLATFLDCDANVNATAARLITHRHTIRYRFERVRELTGLDVSVDRRPREAVARAEGDARARHRGAARPGHRAGRRGRARTPIEVAHPMGAGRVPR